LYATLDCIEDSPQPESSTGVHANVFFVNSDIDAAVTLDPFTHIYMFDIGFPPILQKRIAEKFNTSIYAEYLISYRGSRLVMGEYGYNVELLHQFPTTMHGKQPPWLTNVTAINY
jgi:hypothetical protein